MVLSEGTLAVLQALEQDIRSERRAAGARKASWIELLGALRFLVDREVQQTAWEELALTQLPESTSLLLGINRGLPRTELLLELQRRLAPLVDVLATYFPDSPASPTQE